MSDVTDELDDSPILEEVLGDALDKLRVFHAKLAEEGEPRGLIGPRDVGIIWERHILNSAAIVPFVRESTANKQFKTVADIGSGWRFPRYRCGRMHAGSPVHACRAYGTAYRMAERVRAGHGAENVTVVRARANEMIEAIVGASGTQGGNRGNGNARNGRNGKGGRNGRGAVARGPVLDLDGKPIQARHPFAVVTCRAVAPMTKLSGWTLPLLERGGCLVALKGRSAQEEIEKASKEIAKCGGVRPRVVNAEVGPGLESTHVLMVDKK